MKLVNVSLNVVFVGLSVMCLSGIAYAVCYAIVINLI